MSVLRAIQLLDENGVPYGVRHVNNKPRVSAMPYLFDIAEGNVPDHVQVIQNGANANVGTTEEIIASQGGVLHSLSAAEQLDVSSSDANDTGAVLSSGTATGGSATTIIDTGATFQTDLVAVGDLVLNDTDGSGGHIISVDSEIQITVQEMHYGTNNNNEAGDTYRVVEASSTGAAVIYLAGVDGSYEPIHEFVVLNGAGVVVTTTSFFRAHIAEVHLAGTSGFNEGAIDIEDTTNTYILLQIAAERNRSQAGYWTVPNGKTFYIVQGDASDLSNKGTTVRMYTRDHGHPFLLRYVLKLSTSGAIVPFQLPLPLVEHTDIEVRAQSIQAGGDVSITFHGWYE